MPEVGTKNELQQTSSPSFFFRCFILIFRFVISGENVWVIDGRNHAACTLSAGKKQQIKKK